MASKSRAARLLAVAVLAIAAAVAVVTPARATGPFSCSYWFVSWQNGFTAELRITNQGPTVWWWTSQWSFDNDERLGLIWSAVMTQQGNRISATPAQWNTSIPSGGSVSFGWTATATATQIPDDITVNGVACPTVP